MIRASKTLGPRLGQKRPRCVPRLLLLLSTSSLKKDERWTVCSSSSQLDHPVDVQIPNSRLMIFYVFFRVCLKDRLELLQHYCRISGAPELFRFERALLRAGLHLEQATETASEMAPELGHSTQDH